MNEMTCALLKMAGTMLALQMLMMAAYFIFYFVTRNSKKDPMQKPVVVHCTPVLMLFLGVGSVAIGVAWTIQAYVNLVKQPDVIWWICVFIGVALLTGGIFIVVYYQKDRFILFRERLSFKALAKPPVEVLPQDIEYVKTGGAGSMTIKLRDKKAVLILPTANGYDVLRDWLAQYGLLKEPIQRR